MVRRRRREVLVVELWLSLILFCCFVAFTIVLHLLLNPWLSGKSAEEKISSWLQAAADPETAEGKILWGTTSAIFTHFLQGAGDKIGERMTMAFRGELGRLSGQVEENLQLLDEQATEDTQAMLARLPGGNPMQQALVGYMLKKKPELGEIYGFFQQAQSAGLVGPSGNGGSAPPTGNYQNYNFKV